ncbi:MAG: hypothetical protein HFJ20_04145 [Clostridia bacterium]|nr:hypothetical protein [Clostridia bacterium]
MNNQNKYNDIINLEHHISKIHKQMSLENRAVQFAPFSALTGYDEAIKETARITQDRIELDEELKHTLNKKIICINNQISSNPKVTITYFVPDSKKLGGKYQTITGNVRKIDKYNKIIMLINGLKIPIIEIIDIVICE